MNKPSIFLSYGIQESPERSLKLLKALNEHRALQKELNQVTKATKTFRQWLNDCIYTIEADDLSTALSNVSKVIPAISTFYSQDNLSFASSCSDFQKGLFSGDIPNKANSLQDSVHNYAPSVFDKHTSGYTTASHYLPKEESHYESDNLGFLNQTTSCESYVKDSSTSCEMMCNESISWLEFQNGYFLFVESSLKEKKLRKRSKKIKRELRELKGLKRIGVNGNNSPIRVFQRLQSIRINDKSGDEFNNLEKNKASRLLIFKN